MEARECTAVYDSTGHMTEVARRYYLLPWPGAPRACRLPWQSAKRAAPLVLQQCSCYGVISLQQRATLNRTSQANGTAPLVFNALLDDRCKHSDRVTLAWPLPSHMLIAPLPAVGLPYKPRGGAPLPPAGGVHGVHLHELRVLPVSTVVRQRAGCAARLCTIAAGLGVYGQVPNTCT